MLTEVAGCPLFGILNKLTFSGKELGHSAKEQELSVKETIKNLFPLPLEEIPRD